MEAIKTDTEKVDENVTIKTTPHQLVGTDREYMIPAAEPYVVINVIDNSAGDYEIHRFEDHEDDGTLEYVGPDEKPPAKALLTVQEETDYMVV